MASLSITPKVGFIVANLDTRSRVVVRFYNMRDTAEQWIKGRAGSEDDADELSSFPFKPGEVVAESAGLELGQFLAARAA